MAWTTARPEALRGLQAVVALLSALVLAVTGYAWSAYHRLGAHLVTSDVLASGRAADGATDILLVGLDSRTDAAGNPLPRQLFDALHVGPDEGTLNTDTLVLVRIPNDPAAPTTALSIPRDSYVAIPGFGTHKINSAYGRAADATRARLTAQGVPGAALEQQADQAGRRTLIATVEQLTGASVDHYAEVNLAGFAEITQAVGGVPVCLNAPVRDSYSGADFPAGRQTLSGAPALAFVRQRHGLPRGDLDRVVRQQAFLASLAHEVLSAGTLADPAQLSRLIAAVSHYVVVDPGWDLLDFVSRQRGLTGGHIAFRTIPTERLALPTPEDGLAVEVDPATVRAFVADVTSTAPAAATPAPATPGVTVDVRNATRRTGLAAGVMGLLDERGFVPGRTGTIAPAAGSAVLAPPVSRGPADQVATVLGGLPVRIDAAVPAGHVEVVLGRSYAGPTAATGATGAAASTGAGTGASSTTGEASSAAAAPPITAAGVPCVN
jgi:LCP family protein required for cell wall assembly